MFNGILNDIARWSSSANNEKEFKSNLHASLMTRSINKIGISNLTDSQLKTFKDKWQDIKTKGRSKT